MLLKHSPDEIALGATRELCRRSLAAFAKRAWPILEPATELKWGWALDAICEHLEAVSSGEIKRLLMNVPPGPMRADSLVETGRGIVRLDQVVVGDTVLTHKGRYRRVEAVHDQGILPILKITTNSGRETFAAPSHPYLTPRGWVQAGDLTAGDLLAVVNRVEDRAEPVAMTPEEARFLGYIVGDGCVTHAPGFVNADADVIDDFVRCAEALDMGATKRKRKSFWRVGLRNARPLLEKHGLLGCNSYTKRIPASVMNGTAETIRNFLGAYWSCDGGINVRPSRSRGSIYRAYATTVSEGLAHDLVMALGLVGIEARLRRKSRKLETAAQPGGIYRSFSIEVQNEAMTSRVVALPAMCDRKVASGIECRVDFDRLLWGDEIVSIEAQEDAHCMCLTVAEDHSFTCSGIAVKNSMKSLLTGVIWPAWEWGPRDRQELRYLGTAHKQDLAVRDNTKCRRLIQSAWYQRLWPVQLVGDQNSKLKFESSRTGFREAMAFTSLTGSRGDRCLVGDTKIATDTGEKTIAEIVIAAKPCNVLAYDEHTGKVVQRPIEAVARRAPARIYRVRTASGCVAECTEDHRWYTQRGYVEARLLSEGDAILRAMPKGVHEDGCRGEEERPGRANASLLQQQLLDNIHKHEKWQSRAFLQCLWSQDAEVAGQEAVLGRLRGSGARSLAGDYGPEADQPPGSALRGMWSSGPAANKNASAALLFARLQECGTFETDASGGEPGLARRGRSGPIFSGCIDGVQQDQAANHREGRRVLCGLPFTKRVDRAPYRHGRREQCAGESRNALCGMPYNDPRRRAVEVCFDPVAVVEDLCREEIVYDIQVEGTRNFFANGLLSHNCILDDPHSVDDANSLVKLEADIVTFREALPSRVNNDDSAIVIVMQRLHEKDVSAVAVDLGYDHLCIPMRYEEGRSKWVVGAGDPRTREGELMFPERFPEKQVAELERTLGAYATAGQLQQRPAPREGGLFKASWFETIRAMPNDIVRTVRGWDLAATAKSVTNDPDWTAGVLMSRTREGLFIIHGCRRFRGTPMEVENALIQQAPIDGTHVTIRLAQDPGQAGKAQAEGLVRKLAGYTVRVERPTGDKATRASPLAAQAEAGNVRILATGDPDRDAWIQPFLDELCLFPASAHDDQVDAAADAFNELAIGKSYTYSLDAL